MNPARAFGPDLARGDLSTWWVYILGPLAGAVVAVFVAGVFRGSAKAQEQVSEETLIAAVDVACREAGFRD